MPSLLKLCTYQPHQNICWKRYHLSSWFSRWSPDAQKCKPFQRFVKGRFFCQEWWFNMIEYGFMTKWTDINPRPVPKDQHPSCNNLFLRSRTYDPFVFFDLILGNFTLSFFVSLLDMQPWLKSPQSTHCQPLQGQSLIGGCCILRFLQWMIRHPVSNITKQHLAVLTLVELVLDRKDLTHSSNKIKLWVLDPMDLTRTALASPQSKL